MKLFFFYLNILGAKAEICQIFSLVKRIYSKIIWPLLASIIVISVKTSSYWKDDTQLKVEGGFLMTQFMISKLYLGIDFKEQ